MRWFLRTGDEPGTAIDSDKVGPGDEFLCGNCGALLAVDHELWSNAHSSDGSIACSVCHAVNSPKAASRVEP